MRKLTELQAAKKLASLQINRYKKPGAPRWNGEVYPVEGNNGEIIHYEACYNGVRYGITIEEIRMYVEMGSNFMAISYYKYF